MDQHHPQSDEPTRSTKPKTSGDQRFLAFSLGDENYAVPLLKVREVIALNDITPVPYAPSHFKGIMNLRGQVISVIDLRVKFKMQKQDLSPETAIVILDLHPLCLGVIVDSVDSVLALDEEQISPSPDIESSISADYINGVARIEKRLVLILDIEKTLSVEDLSAMKRASNNKKAA